MGSLLLYEDVQINWNNTDTIVIVCLAVFALIGLLFGANRLGGQIVGQFVAVLGGMALANIVLPYLASMDWYKSVVTALWNNTQLVSWIFYILLSAVFYLLINLLWRLVILRLIDSAKSAPVLSRLLGLLLGVMEKNNGRLPERICACVGGGSNSIGLFGAFLNDPVEIIGVEPLGKGKGIGENAASITYGKEKVMHGFDSLVLLDQKGEPSLTYSVASGLDYPSVGPEHAFLHEIGRVKYDTVDDKEALDAFFELSRLEGIIPAIESSHAVAYATRLADQGVQGNIIVNLSGRGDKDAEYILAKYGKEYGIAD